MTKREILEKVKNGEITSEEALKIIEEIDKLEASQEKSEDTHVKPKHKKAKWLIIKAKSSKNNANIKIPLAIIRAAKKINFKSETLGDIDYDALMKFIEEEGTGKFVDVQDEDNNVEIYVE